MLPKFTTPNKRNPEDISRFGTPLPGTVTRVAIMASPQADKLVAKGLGKRSL